jgi:PRC-barrel domain
VAELPTQRDFDAFDAWAGRDVLGPDGDRLGAVDTIFLDEATGVPEWVLVSRDDGPAFVPLAGASVEARAIRVDQAADRVADAPRPEVGDTLSVADEKRLYEHYGLEYSQAESSTVLPEGATAEEPQEERPRLRKYAAAPAPEEPATEEAATADEAPAADEPATTDEPPTTDESPAADEPASPEDAPAEPAEPAAADRMAPRNLSSATPSPLPPPAPQVIPPEGGIRHEVEQQQQRSKFRTAIPVALASAIAALIAVLAWRRRR